MNALPERPTRAHVPGTARLRRFVPLLAVAGLLAAVAIAAALSTPQITRVPVPPQRGADKQALPSFGPTPPQHFQNGAGVQHDTQLPSWAGALVSGVCVALVAAVVGLIIWMVLRERVVTRKGRLPVEQERAVPAADRETVLAAVDAGLSDLSDLDADPRRAVIACWVRLEEAAASAGTPRQPGDSPTDLVLRLLAAHQVSSQVLYPLADLYRLARYATHTVDSGMRDRARSALGHLRAELSSEPAMGTSR
ncbi:DUF4129 domain-containing protein [Rugosimonospora africana]|uniref:Protein-glutamine gamma-glutamyltransferase-like C-terminal domain-containing protein n=1 Tax=Rugosimonospora africana TaxID=556532 RepID=A0A8J3VM98_9ACTN|nr:DUF4129 domain-containing protein [Rugosimonospora africana]GIH12099.1 hypothetical protein Raf01_02710 [Rugosimonospora africana]